MFTMVSFAQDVIVKKDGSTILSKVTEVSDTQVKYKKHSNLDGPTYTVNVSDLQCINYENGTKDTFNSTPVVETPIQETTITYSDNLPSISGERKYSDAELLNMSRYGGDYWKKQFKNGKKLEKIGLYGGSAMFILGLCILNIDMVASINEGLGNGTMICGVVGGATMYFIGANKVKKAKENLSSSALYQYNIPLGKNTMLTADVDLLRDNMTNQQTLGLGFHLNF